MESSRRQQAQASLGYDFEKEDQRRETALAKEQERVDRQKAKRQKMLNSSSYRAMETTAKWMDKYYLDPLIGLLPGGIGDLLSSVFVFPFIYFSLCVVKSIPLTLAVICNILKDMLLGMIPFFIGDIIDVFNRSYIDNLKLIVGFINDDRDVINEVNRKAFWSGVVIFIFCFLIYLMFRLVAWCASAIIGLF